VSTPETEVDVNTVSDENLTVKVTKQPNCQVKFEISVQPPAVAAAYAKAIKNVSKEVSVPGFSKGKAPESFIKEKYGSVIQKEWFDVVVQTGFNDAIQLTHLHPYKEGNIKRPYLQECSLEKGAKFTIEFETRPQIPSIRLEDLNLNKIETKAITEKQEADALYQVQHQFTTYEPVNDRPVQEGDFVDLDLDILEPFPKKVINDARLEVSERGLPIWIREKIIGLKAGESVDGETQPDDDQPAENFKPTPFRAHIHAIWKGETPQADDELAKRVGLQTLDELKQKIRERLEREAKEDAFQAQINQLELHLLEKYHVDLPRSIIDQNKQVRLQEYMNQLQQENGEEFTKANQGQIEEVVERNTTCGLQVFFLLHKLAAEQNIQVSDQEIAEELNRQIALIPSGKSQINIYGDKDEMRNQVYNLALNRKIREFLLEKAQFS
jgi:trigger factor